MVRAWRILSCAALAAIAGCATPKSIEPRSGPIQGITPAEADSRAELVRRDPLAYIRRVTERTRSLDHYTVTLVRQERRGFPFPTLREAETIACWYRRSPFSVRMKWLNENTNFGETAYVAGRRPDKVRFVPRKGFLGFPPGVQLVDMQTPVTWGVTKHPVSDFGIERLMEQTLESIDKANGDYAVEYLGLTMVEGFPRNLHHVRVSYPPSQYAAPIQELFIDVATDIPACTLIRKTDETLDAAYYYRDLDPTVALGDDDFVMEAERPARAAVAQEGGGATAIEASHAAQPN